MSTPITTREDLTRIQWFAMSAYKTRKGGRDAQRQGWSRVFHTETLCRKGLSRSEIQKACTSHPESRLRACFPKTDHGFQKNIISYNS